MTGAADRLPRLLALVPYLRTHPGADLAEVAAVFGVDVRQLNDDLNLLWVCGLPGGGPGDLIDFSFEGDTVTLVEAQTLDRPLKLTADEALALRVAARALADVPGLAERDALDSAQAKLAFASGALPESAAASAPPMQVALEPETEALATVRQALDERRQVELSYLVASRDEVTDRTVDPMRLVSVDGRWYLEGWCHVAEAVRLFRLDRMVDASLGAAAEPLPSEAVPRDLAEGLFRPRAEDLTVVLELEPAARWVADYYPVEQATELGTAQDDASGGDGPGALRVELRTPDPAWVVRLALRLGGRGRVVSPPSVVAAVREQAQAALTALGE
ncbi:MAG TPA: WYL domain-containing protein [Frankiaceae bacterium]|jgi:proteasome accessory factor C|nr:WYL domain-containing protein [Frankiaceae bacterium]